MSRWLVGSSSSSRSGRRPARGPASARVSSPPENVASVRSRCSSRKPRPCSVALTALAPVVAAGVLEPRLGARVGVERRVVGRAVGHRVLELGRAAPRARAGPWRRRARSRAARGRARAAGAGRAARCASSLASTSSPPSIDVSPASIRSSVVLPAPLRPDRVMRSRRSRLNETPRISGSPAMSLARSDAMTTATSSRIGGVTPFPATQLQELDVHERGLPRCPTTCRSACRGCGSSTRPQRADRGPGVARRAARPRRALPARQRADVGAGGARRLERRRCSPCRRPPRGRAAGARRPRRAARAQAGRQRADRAAGRARPPRALRELRPARATARGVPGELGGRRPATSTARSRLTSLPSPSPPPHRLRVLDPARRPVERLLDGLGDFPRGEARPAPTLRLPAAAVDAGAAGAWWALAGRRSTLRLRGAAAAATDAPRPERSSPVGAANDDEMGHALATSRSAT